MTRILDYFSFPFKGLRLIFRTGFRRYALVPIVLNVVLLILIAWLASLGFENLMARYLPEDSWWGYLRPLVWMLFAVTYLMGVFFGFTVIANLIGAPFNSKLSARIEATLTGSAATAPAGGLASETLAAVTGELRKLGYFILGAIPILLLFLVPGLNLMAPAAWFLFGCWWLTLEYLDYPLGNQGLALKAQRSMMRQHRFACLAFGAGASLLLLIPIINLVAMPATVAGATLFALELRERDRSRRQQSTQHGQIDHSGH